MIYSVRSVLFALFMALTIVACSTFPELDQRTTRAAEDAPYPNLLPMSWLNSAEYDRTVPAQAVASLEARVAYLRRRATFLRQRSIMNSATRAKLLAALERHS